MEQFYTNFKALNDDQRRAKLDHILGYLRQHNANEEANAFQELRCCYPKFAFSPAELSFREYLAWGEVLKHQDHHIVRQILASG